MAKPFVKKIEISDESIMGLFTIDPDAEWGKWFKDKNGKVLLTNVDNRNLCTKQDVSVFSEIVLTIDKGNGETTLVSPVIFKPVQYMVNAQGTERNKYYFGRDACFNNAGTYPCAECYNDEWMTMTGTGYRCISMFTNCQAQCYSGFYESFDHGCIDCRGPAVGLDVANHPRILKEVQYDEDFSPNTKFTYQPNDKIIPRESPCDVMCQVMFVAMNHVHDDNDQTTKSVISYACQAEAGMGDYELSWGEPSWYNYGRGFQWINDQAGETGNCYGCTSRCVNTCFNTYSYMLDCNGFYAVPGPNKDWGEGSYTDFWGEMTGVYPSSGQQSWQHNFPEQQPYLLGTNRSDRYYTSTGQNGLTNYSFFKDQNACALSVEGMQCAHNTSFYYCPNTVSCIQQNTCSSNCYGSYVDDGATWERSYCNTTNYS